MHFMMLAAHSPGIGSCYIGQGWTAFSDPYGQAFLYKCQIRPDYYAVMQFLLGYPRKGGNQAAYACVNLGKACAPIEIINRSICIKADIGGSVDCFAHCNDNIAPYTNTKILKMNTLNTTKEGKTLHPLSFLLFELITNVSLLLRFFFVIFNNIKYGTIQNIAKSVYCM